MLIAVIALYALGAVLPLAGLIRFARRARREFLDRQSRPNAVDQIRQGIATGYYPVEPMHRAAQMADEAPVTAWTQVRWDLGLIGGGIVCATIASIWSLFV